MFFNVVAAASLFRPPYFYGPRENQVALSQIEETEVKGENERAETPGASSHLLVNDKATYTDNETGNDRGTQSSVKNGVGLVVVYRREDIGDKKESHEKEVTDLVTGKITSPLVDVDATSKLGEDDRGEGMEELQYRSFMGSTGSMYLQPLPHHKPSSHQEETNEGCSKRADEGTKDAGIRTVCADMFNFSVMKSYVAVFITIASFLESFGYFNFVLFLPAAVLSRGITKYDKAILVSLCGAGDLAGRLATAALGDRGFVARYKLQAIGIMVVGANIGEFLGQNLSILSQRITFFIYKFCWLQNAGDSHYGCQC